MVVMDREEYIKKREELLSQSTYKTIPTDPTTKYKNKLISLLKTIVTLCMMIKHHGTDMLHLCCLLCLHYANNAMSTCIL